MPRSTVAALLRADLHRASRERSRAENLREALELGERAIRMLMERNGLDREAAIRLIERQHQIGRRPTRTAPA